MLFKMLIVKQSQGYNSYVIIINEFKILISWFNCYLQDERERGKRERN